MSQRHPLSGCRRYRALGLLFAAALTSFYACDKSSEVTPKFEVFRIESGQDGSRTIVKLSEHWGQRNLTATIYQNQTVISDFCARFTEPGVTDSLYVHTLSDWQPGDRIWADIWQPEIDGIADQEVFLE